MEKTIENKEHRQLQFVNWFLLFLFAMQPIMDVASYWLTELGHGTAMMLVLRTFLFFATALIGFLVSRKKKMYFILAGILGVFWVVHYLNCIRIGYPDLMVDLNNYFRLIQPIVFTLAFLSIFRFYGTEKPPIKKAFLINYGLILFVVILSVITGTDPHTYTNTGVGIKGWFYTGNAQSAVLAMIIPIVLYFAYQSGKKLLFLCAGVVCYAHLFLTGTKITYFSIFVFTGGFLLALIFAKSKQWFYYVIPVVLAALCIVFYPFSPMNRTNSSHNDFVVQEQGEIDDQFEIPPEEEKPDALDPDSNYYGEYYQLYMGIKTYAPMVEKFGLEAVLEQTDYTTDMGKLSNARITKNNYNFILFGQQDLLTKMFGMHYNMELCGSQNYDSENDFLGILFLYGYVGFSLYLAFTAGFIIYFLYHLIRSFKQVFSVEFICVLVGLCMALFTAIFTAGMLRRPNASFYMSILLAYGCYLVWTAKKEKNTR